MSFRNPSHYTMNMMNSSQSNFNNAFTPNQNLIPQRDSKNYGDMIHNNVNNNVLSEIVTEYTIHADSKDRDTSIYPNPYSFSISLGGIASYNSNRIKVKDGNGNWIYTSGTVTGVPNPRVDMNFKNVKYIKLKYLMLPRNLFYDVTTDVSDNKVYSIASTKSTILSNYRYLILKIKEIVNDKLYSTSDTRNDCFIIYRDSNYHDAINDLWFATQPVKIFYDNGLKNLSKITIQILLPDAQTELNVQYNNDGSKTNLPYNEINVDNSTSHPSSDFYTKFNESIQTSMEFELGVCENQINAEKNYR